MASSAADRRRGIVKDERIQPNAGLAAVLVAERARLLRFFTARTGSATEAEDVLQEIWLRIAENDLGPIGSPLSYLYRAGANVINDRARERQRRGRREARWIQSTVDIAASGEAIDETPSAFRQAAAAQRLQQLASAITALPPGAQRVFRLHKLDGLSHTDIATKLGITRSAVEKHMAVALRHLLAACADSAE